MQFVPKTLVLSFCTALTLSMPMVSQAKVEGDTIVLGAALSLTGKYTTEGNLAKQGYELAIQRVNEKGGVQVGDKTYRLDIVYYDDESTPARGAQLVERLIQQDNIQFMLGPYSSGLTTAIAPVTEQYNIPMIEANGAARALFNKGYRYLFAVLSTSDQYLQEAVNLAAEQAAKDGRDPASLKLAIAVENDPFSLDVRDGVIADAERHGMDIVIDDKLPRELNDMAATLTKVRALRPDVLVVSGHAKGAALAVRQTAEMKVDVPLMALTHCDSADVINQQQFGTAAEGVLCATQWAPQLSYSDPWFGSAAEYAQDFEQVYGIEPPYQAAQSSAAVLVWVDALQRAGSFEIDKVRDAIAATDMQTFFGNVRFDETGKNIAKPMVLYQVQNGEYKIVAPTKWASDELVFPKPPL